MWKSKFTESQVVAILAEGHAGLPVPNFSQKHGISNTLYCRWKSNFFSVSQASMFNELNAVIKYEPPRKL